MYLIASPNTSRWLHIEASQERTGASWEDKASLTNLDHEAARTTFPRKENLLCSQSPSAPAALPLRSDLIFPSGQCFLSSSLFALAEVRCQSLAPGPRRRNSHAP